MKQNKLKKTICVILSVFLLMGAFSFSVFADDGEVVILYTNDIHTYIDKELTYSIVSSYKNSFENAILVDAGDHIQGTAFGSMDKGKTITDLMNVAGYDIATLGNHEFDYGMEGCLDAVDRAEFSYISCNFYFCISFYRENATRT